jgi:uncharacterized protein
MGDGKDRNHLLTIKSGELGMPYEWSVGKYGSMFFKHLREHGRFLGIRCSKCGKVRVPPRRLCGPCFEEMDELVDLPLTGIIRAFTIVNYPFIDPATGLNRLIPYTYGYIKIDNSDNFFSHAINETDESKIRVGMKVKAVLKEKGEMEGNIKDIEYFEIIR